MTTLRVQRDANSGDTQLMFLQDCNLVASIGNGDAVVFDEESERFVPSANHVVVAKTIKLTDVPTSSDGLVAGEIWSNAGVLTIID